jgi:hypothetical protein
MANRVQDRSRSGSHVSGRESLDEKEAVRGQSEKWGEEVSDTWIESDSDSKAEGKKSQKRGDVQVPRLSTRSFENAHRALANFSAATTTATTATTSTTARPPADPPPRRKGSSPLPMRHAMPDGSDKRKRRDTPPSPTMPRFVGARPKTPAPSASSAASSPRRASAASSVTPAHTPRSRRLAPGTPRSAALDVADRNIAIALAAAGRIATRKGPNARLKEFRSVLSQASAIAPGARGDLVLALVNSLSSLADDAKGACIAELRELTADMPAEFRKSFLQLLLQQLTSNRDSSSDDASETDSAVDADRFAKGHDRRESRCAAIGKLMGQQITDASLAKLAARIRTSGVADVDRGAIATVINGLGDLESNDQNKVIALFDDADIGCAEALGALLQSAHGREIGKQAKSSGYSLATLYLGILTGNRAAMQKLLLILGNTSLPVSLHVYLAEEIGALRRAAVPAPTLAAASRAVLLEIVSMSTLAEAQRCLLMHALAAVGEDKLYAALKGGELDDGSGYWAYAHRLIANVIDVGSCFAIGSDNNPDPDLAGYALRARKLMKDDSVRTILDQGKCDWDAPRLRALMLGKADVKEIKKAVFNVLASNLPFADKLAVLKAEADPLGESVEAEVRKAQYEEAVMQYKKKHQLESIASDFAYAVVKDDAKKHDIAYGRLTRDLDPDARGEIRQAGKLAMLAAQRSRLPAMHVAAGMMSKSELVLGYMQTVAGFAGKLEERDIAACLELSHNGVSLFYTAMMKGTAAVVEACMSVILDAELSLKTRMSLLEARRQPDRLGAFYIAMSAGLTETALEFAQAVLRNETIANDAKVQLLQCAKPASAKKHGLDPRASKALEKAATTARAEAERMKHARLESEFSFKVERSALSPAHKTRLQTT